MISAECIDDFVERWAAHGTSAERLKLRFDRPIVHCTSGQMKVIQRLVAVRLMLRFTLCKLGRILGMWIFLIVE
jgi:hypothetical protein